MVNCAVYKCNSQSAKKEEGISFHRFPRNEEKRALWVANMRILNWFPSKNDRICSKHFETCCFYKTNEKTKLLNEAIPTIYPELSTSLQSRQGNRKRIRSLSTSAQLPTDTPSKKKLKQSFQTAQRKLKVETIKIIPFNQSLKRSKRKIVSLKHVIRLLETKCLITNEQSNILANISTFKKELLMRKFGKQGKSSEELRKFALTINFYSPNAYDYIRKTFDTCLPHRSTISKWYQKINAEPGFTTESINCLKLYAENSNKKSVLCSLIIDDIAIRQHLEWDGKKFIGYVNFGVDLDDDSNQIAKEAFVIMVVNINGTWKIPVGYFLTDSLNGQQKSSIITQCLTLLEETGIEIVSLTFDGTAANIVMCHLLGCQTDPISMKPFFTFLNRKIFIFYNPCHMLKLVQNAFVEQKLFKDHKGDLINWEYIRQLHLLQESEELHFGNKLQNAHVSFFKQKMKVSLAGQGLSKSVADALEFCNKTLKLKNFEGCEGTVRFIKYINTAFDILNSRTVQAPGFKKALCPNNIVEVLAFVAEFNEYIFSLKLPNNEKIINSPRKTGFIGFILDLKNAVDLFNEIVWHKELLIYLPLHKISHDHIELFFSSICSRRGWNNNLTAHQFMAAYKRLIIRTEVRNGDIDNCLPLAQISILSVSSTINKTPEEQINSSISNITEDNLLETEKETQSMEKIFSEHRYIMNTEVLSHCSEEIITYIAGFVTKHLLVKIKCEPCITALIGNKGNFLNSLISQKTEGGLTYPSTDVVKICQISEKLIRNNHEDLPKGNNVKKLTNTILRQCISIDMFQCLNNHILENEVNHVYFLIKSVIVKYLNIRIYFIMKKQNEAKGAIQNYFTKMILFKGPLTF